MDQVVLDQVVSAPALVLPPQEQEMEQHPELYQEPVLVEPELELALALEVRAEPQE